MRITKKCKTCDKEFEAIKDGQFFCSRKCFKKDYYKRNKERQAKLEATHPTFKCGVCHASFMMPFDPVKNYGLFQNFRCPYCGISREAVVEHAYDQRMVMGNAFTVQFVIQSAIVSSRTS